RQAKPPAIGPTQRAPSRKRVLMARDVRSSRVGGAASVPGSASQLHLAGNGPGVRHWTQVGELVGVDHGADRLDLPVEYVEGQCADDLVVAIAEDRARLA